MKQLIIGLLALALTACKSSLIKHKDGSQSARPFKVEDLAKTDVDMMTEIHQQEVLACLKLLTSHLYRLDPVELRKSGAKQLEEAVDNAVIWPMEPKPGPDWAARVRDAFRKEYPATECRR